MAPLCADVRLIHDFFLPSFLTHYVELDVNEKLLVNDKITASCQRSTESQADYMKHYKQQK